MDPPLEVCVISANDKLVGKVNSCITRIYPQAKIGNYTLQIQVEELFENSGSLSPNMIITDGTCRYGENQTPIYYGKIYSLARRIPLINPTPWGVFIPYFLERKLRDMPIVKTISDDV